MSKYIVLHVGILIIFFIYVLYQLENSSDNMQLEVKLVKRVHELYIYDMYVKFFIYTIYSIYKHTHTHIYIHAVKAQCIIIETEILYQLPARCH